MPIVIENLDIKIGENLKKIRLLRQVSLEKLGQHMSVSYQQIHKYEKGINRIPSAKLKNMADYLDVNIGSFFLDDLQNIDLDLDKEVIDMAKKLKEIILNNNLSVKKSVRIILEEFFKHRK
jgi:transcriptional regulator with XRE-family HTH domain